MKINKIMTVAESLSNFVNVLKEAEADPKAFGAMANLDDEIRENLIYLSEVLGFKVPSNNKKSEESETEKKETATIPIGFNSTHAEDPKHIEVTGERDFTVEYKAPIEVEPGYFSTEKPCIIISKNGDVKYKDVNGVWLKAIISKNSTNVTAATMVNGKREYITVGRLMLKTFVGTPTDGEYTYTIEFKDGNRENLTLDNISWVKRTHAPGISNETWHTACKRAIELRIEDPKISMPAIGRKLAEEGILSSGSWLNCEKQHPRIFNQYFKKNKKSKSYEPIVSNPDIVTTILTTEDVEKRVEATKKFIAEKRPLSDDDKVIPILTCVMSDSNHLDSTPNIMSRLNKRYGKLYISQRLVDEVKAKKIRKDLCDLVF